MLATDVLEAELRAFLRDMMPLEHAPSHLRLAFHDAGTHDVRTRVGGANGSIRLIEELRRADNAGWAQPCIELLAEVKRTCPDVSWADLIAIGGAAGVQKCGGPVIEVGLGRVDHDQPSTAHMLPGGYEGARLLRKMFTRMGLHARDLVALTGAHTLGHVQRQPFTPDIWVFSNSYYIELLAHPADGKMLPSDEALLRDPELRELVELYAANEARFLSDFADAYRRLTWLGYASP
jgi:L-ascorbate peroxidase